MNKLNNYINALKALSDKTRLRIFRILLKSKKKLCVCEIMNSLNENQYNISRHLQILKNSGLVECQEQGKWSFYSIKKSKDKFYIFLQKAVAEMIEDLFYLDDLLLEKRLSLRRNGKCVIGMENKVWRKILKELNTKKKKERR